MTFWGLVTGAWMRASPSGTVSSPGSGLPPNSMNSIMSSWARGLISSPSRDPTRDPPPSTEYVTSFKGSPLSGIQDAALRILAVRRVLRAFRESLTSPSRALGYRRSAFSSLPLLMADSAIRIANRLWLQTLYLPSSFVTQVEETVVESVFASLPELDGVGLDPVAAPERGAWDLAPLVLGFEHPDPLFQDAPVLDGAALLRSPGPETASARTAREVGVGLFAGEATRTALDPDLPLQLAPVEKQGARRVRI